MNKGAKGKQALLQSALVAGFVLLAFFAIYWFHSRIALASLAASAFIAFAFPTAESGRPRFLIGGYACAFGAGLLCFLCRLAAPAAWGENLYFTLVLCVLAVFVTSFSMLTLDLQHPPAAALAVSLACDAAPLLMGLVCLVWVAALVAGKALLWRYIFQNADTKQQ